MRRQLHGGVTPGADGWGGAGEALGRRLLDGNSTPSAPTSSKVRTGGGGVRLVPSTTPPPPPPPPALLMAPIGHAHRSCCDGLGLCEEGARYLTPVSRGVVCNWCALPMKRGVSLCSVYVGRGLCTCRKLDCNVEAVLLFPERLQYNRWHGLVCNSVRIGGRSGVRALPLAAAADTPLKLCTRSHVMARSGFLVGLAASPCTDIKGI